MNRFSAVLAFCGVFLAALLVAQAARAQESLPDEQINQIRQNCVKAQATLYQLHANDGLLRNSRGSLYELVSTKLMTPLNVRIAQNHLGGLKLAATALEYDKQLAAFRSSYQQYEESMSRILDIKCQDQPMDFYNGVKTTREKRQKLHEDTTALTALLQTYKTDFEDFAKENNKEAK